MEPGIFERIFDRPTLEATLDAVAGHGLRHVQLDLASAELPSIPQLVPDDVASHIRQVCEMRGITVTAVSGTYNMIHPDTDVRDAGLEGLRAIASSCHAMGTSMITLCTGTRDPDSMWRRHPENDSHEA